MQSPRTEEEALAEQDALRARVLPGPGPASPGAVAGLDVAYLEDRLAAAVVVLDPENLETIDTAVVGGARPLSRTCRDCSPFARFRPCSTPSIGSGCGPRC